MPNNNNNVSKFKKILVNFFSFSSITQISIFLLYFIAIVSFFTGIFTATNWSTNEFSKGFIAKNIILPFLAVSLSFAIQIISLVVNNKKITKLAEQNTEDIRDQSMFLSALENVTLGPGFRRVLLSKLVEEWSLNLKKLSKGIMTIHRNFWDVCTEVYEFSKNGGEIETTSLLPISEWKENENLVKYNRYLQKLKKNNNVKISRTFIFEQQYLHNEFYINDTENLDKEKVDFFFDEIVSKQIEMGFDLYYIILDDIEDEFVRSNLQTDFAMMDNSILMIGVYPDQTVYSYEFYDLDCLVGQTTSSDDSAFRLVRKVINNFYDVCDGKTPELLIDSTDSSTGLKYRKRIEDFNLFGNPWKLAVQKVKDKYNA